MHKRRMSLLALATAVIFAGATLGAIGGASPAPKSTGSSAAPSVSLAPKSPVPAPAGVASSNETTPPTICTPHPTATVTLTVVKPRTDGIFVGTAEHGDIGIRFLPDGTLLYAINIHGTPVQQFKHDLTLQNVARPGGDWQHVAVDSVGDFTITIFGGQDFYTVRSYTSHGFTLFNQNNFGCVDPAQVHLSTINMAFQP